MGQGHSEACPYLNKPEQTGTTHRGRKEEEKSFWTSLLLMHKNVYT